MMDSGRPPWIDPRRKRPVMAGRMLLAIWLLVPAPGARGAVLSPGATGCVIYRAGPYETDDKFRIAEYKSFDDFRTGTVFKTLSGEILRLTPGHRPIIIPYPAEKKGDPGAIKKTMAEAKERFPHLAMDIVALEEAWNRPVTPEPAGTGGPAGTTAAAGGKRPPLTVKGGKVFEGWTISRVDGDQVRIVHAGGVATVPLADLPGPIVSGDPRLAAAVAEIEKAKAGIAPAAAGAADGATPPRAGMEGGSEAALPVAAETKAAMTGWAAPVKSAEGLAPDVSAGSPPEAASPDMSPQKISLPEPPEGGRGGGTGDDAAPFGLDLEAAQRLWGPMEEVTETEVGGALLYLSGSLSRHLGVRAELAYRVGQAPAAFGKGMVLLGLERSPFGQPRVVQLVWIPAISGCGIGGLGELLGPRRRPMLAPAEPPPETPGAALRGFQDWDAFSPANEWRAIRLPGDFEVRLLNARHRLVAGTSPRMCVLSQVSDAAYGRILAWNCRGAIARMGEPARGLFSAVLLLHESSSGAGPVRLSRAGAAIAIGRWDLVGDMMADDVIASLERDSEALKGAEAARGMRVRLAMEILRHLPDEAEGIDGLKGVVEVLRSEFARKPITDASLDRLDAAVREALWLVAGLPAN